MGNIKKSKEDVGLIANLPVGETFPFKDTTLMVVAMTGCTGCYFNGNPKFHCSDLKGKLIPMCGSFTRRDALGVVFMEVNGKVKNKVDTKSKLEPRERKGKWTCKKCGGKMRISVSRVVNEDFNISKDGEPIGKCLKKLRGEVEADNYYCSKCGTWYDSGMELSDIADWEEGD